MERQEKLTESPHLPAVEGASQPVGIPPGAQSQSTASQDERQPGLGTDVWELQSQGKALQLEFQESGLSPALYLLPATSGVEQEFTESFFSQQSDSEFAPLRQYPDISGALKKFLIPPQDCTTHSECSSLSQHTLAQNAIPSEEEANTCCILSQCDEDVPHHPSSALQPSPLMSLGRFSDVSLGEDLTLSSSQESYVGIKIGASVGSSSAVSLELDNYAPYWTSKQSSPPLPSKSQEFNVDEQVLLYLHNLGIDQSHSKILTASTPRGPIRKSEFSSTNLCTIKGSPGTPSKSTQPPEVKGPLKGEFSRSSTQSVDSSTSTPFHLDSLGPAVSIPEQVRTRSSPLYTEATRSKGRVVPRSQLDSSTLQPSQQQQESKKSINHLANRSDSDRSFNLKTIGKERDSDSPFQRSQSMDRDAESTCSHAKTLSENCKLCYHSENIISTGSSAASSVSVPPCLFSDEDIFRSIQIKSSRLQDSSFSSHSTAGSFRTRSSLLGARSLSDSMLTSEKARQISVVQDCMSSSWQPDYPSAQNVTTSSATTVTWHLQKDGTVGSKAERTRVISKSAQRTEPEGCSAASPDKVPTQLQVMRPSPAASTQQLSFLSADRRGISEEVEKRTPGVPAAESHCSSSISDGADQEVMSDVSSEGSLAVRVAKLLQEESPATMVSSTPSITDQEEGKSKEWLKLKASGQRSETLELDAEDRKCIEDIKKELLLINPMKSQGSTDTESSASSSLGVNKERNPPHSETFSTVTCVNDQKGLSVDHLESHTQLQCTLHSEAQVPPLSPATHPQHLTELFTETGETQTLSSEPPPMDERSDSFHRRNQSVTCQSDSWNQNRLMPLLVGGLCEVSPSPTQDLDKINESDRHESTQSFNHREELFNHTRTPGANQAAVPLTVAFNAGEDHVSHVHLTHLSPHHTSTSVVHHTHTDGVSGLPQQNVVVPRDPTSAASSPDEGVGLSSPPEWYNSREPARPRVTDRSDNPSSFKTVTAASVQSFPPQHRSQVLPRTFIAETPVPILLPYKPRGSEDVFYVPQTEADVSSTEQSDTTIESTHIGSDDAVPPRFSSEVLGNLDPGLDRGVTFRHTEGIYSKHLKTSSFKMQKSEHGADKGFLAVGSKTPKLSIQASASLSRVPPRSNYKVPTQDQGTNPVQFLHYEQAETNSERFHPDHVKMIQTSVCHTRGGQDLPQVDSQSCSSTLDHLWEKFCTQWAVEEPLPTGDREASLLERLGRLSRLVHQTKAANVSNTQEGEGHHLEEQLGRTLGRKERKEHCEIKRSKHGRVKEVQWKVRGVHLNTEVEHPIQQRLQINETVQPEEGGGNSSLASSFSHSSQSHYLTPADSDETETLSATSGSVSTVSTARLIQAFCGHRVQHLKSSSSLGKLYGKISKQREGKEWWNGSRKDLPRCTTPSGIIGTDESVVPDSSSTDRDRDTDTMASHRGPSRALRAKKLVNKSVQAGEVELNINETRRHTRDVGTTFPSPCEARTFRQMPSSSFSVVRDRRGLKNSSKPHSIQKQRKNKRSPSKPFPAAVSWFISVDSLRSKTKKVNRPEESPAWRRSTAWFEPYTRVSPWRETLRQRHEDRSNQSHSKAKDQPKPDPDPKTKIVSSGLTRVSLQEALEMCRPEFISQSRQRVRRLALQVEERKLQAAFNRERNVLLSQIGVPLRLPKPTGTCLLKRAVPRREMIQRSKQIYENLPEVQRRREEERRKAEYQSYRLNAQLYNKRITNHVLGRRATCR